MLSMNPSWNPFITASTTVSVITPTAIPRMESSVEAFPDPRRRAWK